MKKEPFEKIDPGLMRELTDLRQKKVPAEILKGFSASVERRILANEEEKRSPSATPAKTLVPMWAPALIVLILACTVVLKSPLKVMKTPSLSPPETTQQVSPSEISDEISALRELGAWTEEDDNAVVPAEENMLAELELANQA